MKLKNACTFLLIASIVLLFDSFCRELITLVRWGMHASGMNMLYYLFVTVITGTVFALLAVSYRQPTYNPRSRSTFGILLCVASGLTILLNCYSFYQVYSVWYDSAPALFVIEYLFYMVLPIMTLILGIALAGQNPTRIRKAMACTMIGAGAELLVVLYSLKQLFFYGWSSDTPSSMIIDCTRVLDVVFPVALFLWAMVVRRRMIIVAAGHVSVRETDILDD